MKRVLIHLTEGQYERLVELAMRMDVSEEEALARAIEIHIIIKERGLKNIEALVFAYKKIIWKRRFWNFFIWIKSKICKSKYEPVLEVFGKMRKG